MKRVILYLTLFFCLFCKAQDKKDKHGDIILFNKGIALWELYDETLNLEGKINNYDTLIDEQKKLRKQAINLKDEILDKALDYFDELIKQYPKSELFFRALNNKAKLEFDLGYINDAKKSYLAIYLSKAKDTEKGGIGSGIMAEPYANYKNRALKQLSEIENSQGNFTKAIGIFRSH